MSQGAALFFARKGEDTRYPVPYALWEKAGRGPVDPWSSLPRAMERAAVREQQASPAVPSGPSSPWLTAPAEELAGLGGVLGSKPPPGPAGAVIRGGARG